MSERVVILNESTSLGNETGAGLMRNRCAFTSRDMSADWPEAFTYAIVFGWRDEDHPDEDATQEVAERYGWDEELVSFLVEAHERFKLLSDRRPAAEPTGEEKTHR